MNGAANAAHLACEILAVSDDALAEALKASREAGEKKIAEKDAGSLRKNYKTTRAEIIPCAFYTLTQ